MKGKSNLWGIKIFLLCEESGIVYNMILYQSASTKICADLRTKFGLGGAVFLSLVRNISENRHFLYFDNFFSSFNIFYALSQRKIYAAGTIRINRIFNLSLMSDKDIIKLVRGTSYEVTSNLGIGLLKWCDNKPINMGSNFVTSGTPGIVRCWKKKIRIT